MNLIFVVEKDSYGFAEVKLEGNGGWGFYKGDDGRFPVIHRYTGASIYFAPTRAKAIIACAALNKANIHFTMEDVFIEKAPYTGWGIYPTNEVWNKLSEVGRGLREQGIFTS